METIIEEKETKKIINKHISGEQYKHKQFVNCVSSEFSKCTFNGVTFQHLCRCSFNDCVFSNCLFTKDLVSVIFMKCEHSRSDFTKITISNSVFEKTGLHDITASFSTFDTVKFIDGELSSKKTINCVFHKNIFSRYNFLPNTFFSLTTFTGSCFEALSIRSSTFQDSGFKNCSFRNVNQTKTKNTLCSFLYCSVSKSTLTDNTFNNCKYDYFSVDESNILRNSFKGSSMDHTKFSKTDYSYNNLTNGSFNNIKFMFCSTRDNNKKDAVFCNSEMLTATDLEVKAVFQDSFESQHSYIYSLKAVFPTGRVLLIPDQAVVVKENAVSAIFMVKHDILKTASIIQIEKKSNSAFAGVFIFSNNTEEVFKYLEIENKLYFPGVKTINGTTFNGFLPQTSNRLARSYTI